MSSSIFDSEWPRERERLEALSAIFDPGTIRYLEQIGTQKGWRCAEVGAGTGSIVYWLCNTVGNEGAVVAIDLNTRFLSQVGNENLEIRQCDIEANPLEPETYDLIHTRMLLTHVSTPREVIASFVRALKPGGWLLLEELDCTTGGIGHPPSKVLAAAYEAMNRLMESVGRNPRLGREIVSLLLNQGLENVAGEGRAIVNMPGGPGATLLCLGLEFNRERLIEKGLIAKEDLDCALQDAQHGHGIWYSTMAVSGWGKRSANSISLF